MANIKHYQKYQLSKILKHYERALDKDGKFFEQNNQRIDSTLTNQNYNLAKDLQPMKQMDFLVKRLSEVSYLKRNDVAMIEDWVITCPENIKGDKQKCDEFLKGVYKFLVQKYGAKNVVSAYCHFDESTPHMHFCFMPIVQSKKKVRGTDRYIDVEKLSHKECVPYQQVCSFHDDLQKYCNEHLPFEVQVWQPGKNGVVKDEKGNVVTKKHQKIATSMSLKDLQNETINKSLELLKLNKDIDNGLDTKSTVEGLIHGLNKEVVRLRNETNTMKAVKEVELPLLVKSVENVSAKVEEKYKENCNNKPLPTRVWTIPENEKDSWQEKANKAMEQNELTMVYKKDLTLIQQIREEIVAIFREAIKPIVETTNTIRKKFGLEALNINIDELKKPKENESTDRKEKGEEGQEH